MCRASARYLETMENRHHDLTFKVHVGGAEEADNNRCVLIVSAMRENNEGLGGVPGEQVLWKQRLEG